MTSNPFDGRATPVNPDKPDHGFDRPVGRLTPQHLQDYADELNKKLIGHRAGTDWYVAKREEGKGETIHFLSARTLQTGTRWRPSPDELDAIKAMATRNLRHETR